MSKSLLNKIMKIRAWEKITFEIHTKHMIFDAFTAEVPVELVFRFRMIAVWCLLLPTFYLPLQRRLHFEFKTHRTWSRSEVSKDASFNRKRKGGNGKHSRIYLKISSITWPWLLSTHDPPVSFTMYLLYNHIKHYLVNLIRSYPERFIWGTLLYWIRRKQCKTHQE